MSDAKLKKMLSRLEEMAAQWEYRAVKDAVGGAPGGDVALRQARELRTFIAKEEAGR